MSVKRYGRLGRGLLVTGFAMLAGCSSSTTDGSKNTPVQGGFQGLTVILFEHTDMKGESCTVYVPAEQSVSVDAACGAGWSRRVSSARVPAFNQWQMLFFRGSHWRDEVMYASNTFNGKLDIPSLTTPPSPPPDDMFIGGDADLNDNVYTLHMQPYLDRRPISR